jgi:hypothetical protein
MASKIRNGALETIEEASQETIDRTETPADARDMTSILEDTVAITREDLGIESEPVEEPQREHPVRRARRMMRTRRALAALIVGAVAVGVLAGMLLRARASAGEPDLTEPSE